MGIFDFVKGAGAKLGLGDDEKEKERQFDEDLAERRKGNSLMRHVMGLGFEVEKLRVDFDDGVATVTGQAGDQSTREKVVLAIGNTSGVARVDDRMEVVVTAPEATMYTVQSGDSLSKIAKEQRRRDEVSDDLRGQQASAHRSRQDLPRPGASHSAAGSLTDPFTNHENRTREEQSDVCSQAH